MNIAVDFVTVSEPKSIIDGVDQVAVNILRITGLRHRSSLRSMSPFSGTTLVSAIYRIIESNYVNSGASANRNRSRENWRWQSLQPQISPHNRSPEVVIERAIAAACHRLGRSDWANQIPVASGLIGSKRDGRRAIDLVRLRGERHFEFIELKFASDTPLYAAIEIIGYGCLWLIARGDKPSRPSALLHADHIDLRVLAPLAYYREFTLTDLQVELELGVRALGRLHGIAFTFAFEVLDERIRPDVIPDDGTLLACLENPVTATPLRSE